MSNRNGAKKKKKKNIFPKIVLIMAAVFILLALALILFRRPVMSMYYQWKIDRPIEQTTPVMDKNILIDGKEVGGMTAEEALELINSNVDSDTEGNAVVIKSSDNKHTYEYTFQDLDIKFDIDGAVKKAIDFGKNPDKDSWWREFKALEGGKVNFAVMSWSRPKVTSFVNAIASEINVEAKNAGFVRQNGTFTVTPSATGYAIDKDKLLADVVSAIENREFGKEITFDIKVTEPKYTDKDFQGFTGLIGTYSSPYTGGDANRIQNLKNGCAKINGVVVYPNEVFSTNAHFNPCTEANGWASAGTIVNGKIEDSVGGGMCQVSSALYMALLNAEVEITERHNHSMKVGYADYGFDATLAGDYKDLKFKNDTGCAIYLEAYTTASNVVVNIYGKEVHPAGRTLKFSNKFIDSKEPPDPVEKYDPELPEGTRQIETTAMKGVTYELYKSIYENGVLKDTVKVNTSTYSPRGQVTLIGTKKAE